jgi:cholesterol transport system auxiliary component
MIAVPGARLAKLGLITAAVLLVGCSGFNSNSAVTQIYLLQPELPASAAATAGGTGNLVVLKPLVAPGLANERIALTHADGRLDYYQASRWPAELPEVLQALAVDALRARGRFATVQGDATPSLAGYALLIEVRHFEAQYPGADTGSGTPPAARVTLVGTLISRADRTVLSSFTAEGSAQAAANRMGAVVHAFDQALGQALQQLVENTHGE